jgi:DNA repair protein RadC
MRTAIRACCLRTAAHAVAYWDAHIATWSHFNPECECLVVLAPNVRKRVKGHQLAGIGTADSVLAHPREVFRGAIIASASAIILMHNHPSGDPTQSPADLNITRECVRAGNLLRIEVLDHIIIGNRQHVFLREVGHLFVS